jgi:membrane protein DedA with SNARE-associated domain
VFAGRFLPGFRIAVNMSCGAGHMAYPRFLLFDGMGAIVWSAQAAILGFVAGKAFAGQIWLALVVAIGVALLVGAFIAHKERKRLRLERLEAAAGTGPGGAEAPPPGAADPR